MSKLSPLPLAGCLHYDTLYHNTTSGNSGGTKKEGVPLLLIIIMMGSGYSDGCDYERLSGIHRLHLF